MHLALIIRSLIATAVCLLALSATATAEPIVSYPIPGGADQSVEKLVPGLNGSMWFTQVSHASSMAGEGRIRLHRVSANGIEEFVSGEFSGSNIGIESAADGGVWLGTYGDGLVHVGPLGAVESYGFPAGYHLTDLAAGKDGKAWLLACKHTFETAQTQSCASFAISLAGSVSTYELPSFSWIVPATTGYSWTKAAIAGDAGVWFSKLIRINGTQLTHSAFVSYAGAVTSAQIPASTEAVGPGVGSDVWWRRDNDGSIDLGRMSLDGAIGDTHNIPVGGATYAWPDGSQGLLWAADTGDDDAKDGVFGSAGAGRFEAFEAPKHGTSVPPPTVYGDDVWSGSCTFGVNAYRATDGGFWIASAGHPGRVSYRSPGGDFSTFAAVTGLKGDYSIRQMLPSNSGALWFLVGAKDGQQFLSRANPLSPPPGFEKFPGSGARRRASGKSTRIYGRPALSRNMKKLTLRYACLRSSCKVKARIAIGRKTHRLPARRVSKTLPGRTATLRLVIPRRLVAKIRTARRHHTRIRVSATIR